MNVLVMDGQGGKLGRQLVERIRAKAPDAQITAVGTNSAAAQMMLKGGADHAASGENAVRVCAKRADVIFGPLGIVLADALCGEITAEMARAVAQADAVRILIPFDRCETMVAGVAKLSVTALLDDAMEKFARILDRKVGL